MPTYFRPGVYVEEYLNPLSDLAVDPSDSSAAFVGGSTGGGPVGPISVTSWSQYQALFGGVGSISSDDLAYAVYSFFANGGTGAYIVRALNTTGTTAAALTIFGAAAPNAATTVLTVTASAVGVWASDPLSVSRVYVTVTPKVVGAALDQFDLTIEVGTGSLLAAREQFTDLSMNRTDPRYAIDVVNSPVIGSKYVTLLNGIAEGVAFVNGANPATITKTPLTGGSDGTGPLDVTGAVAKLDSVDRNFVINCPGASSGDLTSIVTTITAGGRHFLVADVPKPAAGESAAASVTAMTGLATAVGISSHVAVYGPWLYLVDPASKSGALRLTAPGGAVVGQYLRTDAYRGVHKAPAGIGTSLAAVISPYTSYTNAQQDTIATGAVNLIKAVPGSGVCIMGARTKSVGFPDRYVSVRRLLIAVKAALTSITRFALFENNNEDLWATLEVTVDQYLQGQYDLGAFKGSDPTQSYYVTCDSTNNNAASQDAGVVNIEVGVAVQNPAEFVVIRLGQSQSGTTVTDSLEEE